eukprot:6488867-Amphidinium_carterae.1
MITIRPQAPEHPATPTETYTREYVPRRLYITKKDLDKHGFSFPCRACDLIRRGNVSTGVSHSIECRRRLEKAICDDPANRERVERTIERIREHTDKSERREEDRTEAAASDHFGSSASRPASSAARAPLPPPSSMPVAPEGTSSASAASATPMDTSLGGRRISEEQSSESATKRVRFSEIQAETVSVEGSRKDKRRPSVPPEVLYDRSVDEAKVEKELGDVGASTEENDTGMDAPMDYLALLESLHHEQVISAVDSSPDSDRPVCEEVDFTMDGSIQGWVDDLPEFTDNVTGLTLDPKLVQEARRSELEYINKKEVWQKIPRSEAKARNIPIIKGRWVDVNKAKDKDCAPNYRSRWVAKEIKKGVKSSLVSEFFAAMPPTSSSKTLLALAMTSRIPDSDGNLSQYNDPADPLCVLFIDVKRAHFCAPCKRTICVEIPDEAKEDGEDAVGLLVRSLYGTRDAASNWEAEIAR